MYLHDVNHGSLGNPKYELEKSFMNLPGYFFLIHEHIKVHQLLVQYCVKIS